MLTKIWDRSLGEKTYNRYKCAPPSSTLRRLQAGLSRRFRKKGFRVETIFKRIGQIHSCRTQLKTRSFTLFSNGKGTSRRLALVSAYAELIERLGRHEALNDPQQLTTPRSVRPRTAIHLADLLRKYRLSPRGLSLLLRHLGPNDVWLPGLSLPDNRWVGIPYRHTNAISSSNGLAAGNTYSEAIVQAFCEIFERHAMAKALREGRPLPTIDPRSIPDRRIRRQLDYFRSKNIKVTIKDISFDNRWPCACVILENLSLKDTPDTFLKCWHYKRVRVGSHFDLTEAISRCLTEIVQGTDETEYLLGLADPMNRLRSTIMDHWFIGIMGGKPRDLVGRNPTATHRNYLYTERSALLEKPGPVIQFSDLRSFRYGNCCDELAEIRKILVREGWDAYVIDLSDRRIGFPAVCVIVPNVSDLLDFYIAPQKQRAAAVLNPLLRIQKSRSLSPKLWGIRSFSSARPQDWRDQARRLETALRDRFSCHLEFDAKEHRTLFLITLSYFLGNRRPKALDYLTLLDRLAPFNPLYSEMAGLARRKNMSPSEAWRRIRTHKQITDYFGRRWEDNPLRSPGFDAPLKRVELKDQVFYSNL
ncbi:MAG TPA: YcaO-like family protein [Elusimicrobiota bacterium]|nr:YcaO-like family protein [Elusimicrobiota bacterium]